MPPIGGISEAPKPVAVANVHTGANPRGTAIVLPAPAPKALTTGANPRGTAIVVPQHSVGQVQAAKVKASIPVPTHGAFGGGPTVAAVQASKLPSGFLTGRANIISRLGNEVINLPASTLEAGEELAPAIYHGVTGMGDVLSLRPSAATHQFTPIEHLAKGAVTSDPVYRAITQGSLKPLAQNPLGTIQDALGGWGAIGRGIGAVARSGAVGEDVARAASTGSRIGREVVSGLPETLQHYSPNVLTKGLQQAHDSLLPNGTALTRKLGLKGRVDEFVSAANARAQGAVHDVGQELATAKPPDANAADVVPHAVIGLPHDPVLAADTLRGRLKDLQDAEQATHDARAAGKPAPLDEPALKANQEHQAILSKFLENPSLERLQMVQDSAGDYAARQNGQIDPARVELGLGTQAEQERRALVAYAHANMDGVFHSDNTPKGVSLLTPEHYKAVADQAAVRDAAAKLPVAEREGAVLKAMHGDAEQKALAAERAMAQATQQEARTRGFIVGRYGKARLDGTGNALPKAAAERLDRNVVNTDAGAVGHQDLRDQLKIARADRKQVATDSVAAAKDTLTDAKEQAALTQGDLGSKMKGHLIMHPDGTVEPLSNDVIKANMEANGVDHNAYLRLNAPSEGVRGMIQNWRLRRGGSPGPKFTGTGVRAGAWEPGYQSLAKSQMRSVSELERARTQDLFANQFGLRDANGDYFTDHNWQDGQRQLREQGVETAPLAAHPKSLTADQKDLVHGIQDPNKASGVTAAQAWENRKIEGKELPEGGNGHVVLVPRDALARYEQHEAVSNSTSTMMQGLNRAFRMTVLPTSTKWMTMHGSETSLRLGLRGIGPADRALAGRVLERMDPEAAAHLGNVTMSGQLYGLSRNMNADELGLDSSAPLASNPVHLAAQVARNAPGAKQAIDAYMAYANKVMGGIHGLERQAAKAALGSHMQRQLQELAGSAAEAHLNQSKYLDQLAKGYENPQLASDAAKYVHQTLGKYNSFSPKMRQFVRSVSPFAPWYMNAAKFVYYTMPVEHPLTSAVLSDVQQANAPAWAASHQGLPKGDLQSAMPTGHGGYLDVGRYLPYGAFTNGPVNFLTGLISPQFQGAAMNVLAGEDEFGRPLKGPNGQVVAPRTGRAVLQGIDSLIGSFAGPIGVGARVAEIGPSTAYNTSTLWNPEPKPGTQHGAKGLVGGLQKNFLPWWPTYLGTNNGPAAGVAGAVPSVAGASSGVEGGIPSVQGGP